MQRHRLVSELGVRCGVSETQDSTGQGCSFSFGLKEPIGVLQRSPPNGRLLPERVTTCSWKYDPGIRDWKLFLHQKGSVSGKRTIQPDKSFQPYSKIKQLPSETFVIFVERLIRAIRFQDQNEGAQEQVLEEMALANANEQCKAAILSLSIEPASALHDMLQQGCVLKTNMSEEKYIHIILTETVDSRKNPPTKQLAGLHAAGLIISSPDLHYANSKKVLLFVEVSLQGLSALKEVNLSSQFCIVCKLSIPSSPLSKILKNTGPKVELYGPPQFNPLVSALIYCQTLKQNSFYPTFLQT
ncbi:hypothetical protein DUI87_03711 [Hirundo rustica rustica]|uniref:Retroviral nucleocapsid Gag protein p24 C-terminal domain-containing protein n=1 Tax=Hirundo rustica rustica TaxID=333673 RepID=A0A3M0LJ56_HIRRU|nr:hypothetical protein DUI87_03711 [Hirundo rustica rustica]